MAAERPKRRITQPCLEYNGGLLHKEEIMLRRALYASLTESKKSHQSRMPHVQPSSSQVDSQSYGSMQNANEQCTVSEEWFKISRSVSELPNQNEQDSSNTLLVKGPDKKKKKIVKEPGKLLNYVIKKKKKITKCQTIFKSPSPEQVQASSKSSDCTLSKEQCLSNARVDSGAVPCVTELKKKRRQRGALAVFVAMNKSIGGKTSNLALDKGKQLKTLKKRKRLKRKNSKTVESSFSCLSSGVQKSVEKAEENQPSGVEFEELPVKKPKREQKKPTKVVHAQRKFARTHPLGPNSLKMQEENDYLLATVCSRAKTEDFLTFLCLRNTAVLPKELEIFNNPCLPMSPLSEEDEDNSSPPSPAQSQSSMSNSSNPSSAMHKSSSESPALSVDSPAVGERPCWESGVVRMYADGPKGLAGESKVEKKFEEPLPSDEADDQREMCKSITPPLSFRVSPHPTIWAGYGAKERQLPKPIPKPFVMNPLSLTSAIPCSAPGNSGAPVPSPLIKSAQASSSCSPPPPPLLYIPAAAQRVTHLHGPPTLQRYPSTSPTGDKPSHHQKPAGVCDNGPPPLKRFPRIVIEDESPVLYHDAARSASSEALGSSAPTRFTRRVAHSWVGVGDADRAVVSVDANRRPTCLSDGTSVSDFEELHDSAKPIRGEMPLLRRYSSTSLDIEKRVNEHFELSIKSRALNSRSSPPRLQRIHSSVKAGTSGPSDRFGSSLRAVNVPSKPPALLRHSPLESVLYRNLTNCGSSRTGLNSQPVTPPVLEKAPQNHNGKCFPEAICFKPILVHEPPASPEVSTGFVFSKEKWKSTYVFSNRQTVLLAEKQPRLVRMTSVVAPSTVDIPSVSELDESNPVPALSRAVAARSDVPNTQFVRLSCSNALCTSTQTTHQEGSPANASVVSIARPLLTACSSSSPVNSKRVPSSRSDSFGTVFPKSMDKLTVYSSSPSANSSDWSMTLRSAARQKGTALRSLPPVWCHMESSYSTASVTSSPTLPQPYTFSVTVPTAALLPPLYSESCASSQWNTGRVTSDALGSTLLEMQRSTFNREVEQDVGSAQAANASHRPLPLAFQNEATHHDAKADESLTESTTFDVGLLSSAPRDDHKTRDVDMALSSPPQRQSSLIQSTTRKSPGIKEKAKSVFCDKEITKEKRPMKLNSLKHPKKPAECLLGRTASSPVFRPTEEEFKNPAAYMKAIRSTAEKFGVCVIVPPESWKPEFQQPEGVRFNNECQLVHRLLHRWGPVQEELACIKKHLDQQSICVTPLPQIGGCELDLPQFSRVVKQFGGLQKVIDSKKWTKVADMLKIPRALLESCRDGWGIRMSGVNNRKLAQDRVGKLQDIYCKYLLSYDLLPQEEKEELLKQVKMERENIGQEQYTRGWTLKGRNMSLVPFQRLARNVQGRFFKNSPSANDVEREFWKIVHKRESYVSVHRGTVDTDQEFSCFPNDNGDPYSKHGWNLNILPHLPGSVLKHVGFVSGVTVPWLQFDMTFSVKSWQTHPLALFIVDYLHTGADKIWYSVPAHEKEKFTSVLRSFCAQEDLNAPETEALDKMVSPSTLKDSGVEVTRVVQEQGQFVVVSPEAYYSSISCGYSVSEAVAFAPPDWIMLASQRSEELRASCQWSDFTFDKLLLGLAEELSDESREVVECVLMKLKILRDEEKASMNKLLELGLFETQAVNKKNTEASSAGKKGKRTSSSLPQTDSSCVLYCEDCDQPCFLSAVTREKQPIVLCLKHAAVHIREKKSSEGFRILIRYDTSWLDELVDKVEERLKKFVNPS